MATKKKVHAKHPDFTGTNTITHNGEEREVETMMIGDKECYFNGSQWLPIDTPGNKTGKKTITIEDEEREVETLHVNDVECYFNGSDWVPA